MLYIHFVARREEHDGEACDQDGSGLGGWEEGERDGAYDTNQTWQEALGDDGGRWGKEGGAEDSDEEGTEDWWV